MNQKELNEIRRRLNPERTNIGKIYGTYVNTAKNVIAKFESSVGLMTEGEREMILSVLKGALAGRLGKNLMAIPFSSQEESEDGPYKLLYDLRRTSLADAEIRKKFTEKIKIGRAHV